MTEALLACRGVEIGYGSTAIVSELDLRVDAGEMVALLGPSGSGKSTIIAALAGFLPIRAGEVVIRGRVVSGSGRHEPPERRDVAVVFQNYALWPHLDALETVAFPLRRRGLNPSDAHREAQRILGLLGIGALAGRRPAELSGGEQQRVGLGRALARNAGLYLFDEPTAHLDAALRERLQTEISEHRRTSGAGAIYATHDTAEALALADRVVLLRAGRIVQEGTPELVYACPVDAWAARLTGPASILDVRLADTRDGRAHVAVDGVGQDVRIASASSPAAGHARAMVRPDWVRIGGDVPGRVDVVAFRGTHTDYELATAAGSVRVRCAGAPELARGDVVGWTLDRAWILDGPEQDTSAAPSL